MTDTLTTEELTTIAHYTQAINLLTHRTHQTTDPEAKNFLHQITQHLTNGTLTTEEQITHQEAKGAVATIADTLNITHPATPEDYQAYNDIKP